MLFVTVGVYHTYVTARFAALGVLGLHLWTVSSYDCRTVFGNVT